MYEDIALKMLTLISSFRHRTLLVSVTMKWDYLLARSVTFLFFAKVTFGKTESAPDCAPKVISVQAVSSTSIRVTWSPLRDSNQCRLNGVLRGYQVAYRLNVLRSTMKYKNVSGNASTTTNVSGLLKYTEYSFRILAYTIKDGPWSKEIKTRTNEDAPSCPPKVISVQAVSSTSIRVNWSPLRDSYRCRLNGVLRGYKVAYRLSRHWSTMKYKDIRVSANTTTVVTSLDKYTEYSFQVLAYTVRDGPWSRLIMKRTKEDVPERSSYHWYYRFSVKTLSSTSIEVKWTRPSTSVVNGQLTGYKIRYQPRRGSVKTIDVGLVTKYTLKSLTKFTAYIIQIAVRNNKYTGPWSRPRYVQTIADAPDCPPKVISVQAVSSTSISVTWSPLRDSNQCRLNGVLRGYKVAYRLNGHGSRMKHKYVRGSGNGSTTTVVTGLDKFSEYSFRILASTVMDGPWSKEIKTRTKEDAPSCPPRGISVQAVSSTSIRITWSPLRDSNQCRLNGVLRGYKVAYRLNRHGSTMKYKDVRGSGSITTVVTGLDKYTEYSFQVLAYTVKIGPLSKEIKTKTKEDAPTCSPRLTSAYTVSSTSVKLTWTPLPNTKCRNGVLRGYKVVYKHKQKGSTMMDVGADRTSTVVAGLDKYSKYSFQVLAYTVKNGPKSKETETRTKEDEPEGAPQEVSVNEINITSYRVTWKPVREDLRNGIITTYQVCLTLVNHAGSAYNSQTTYMVSSKASLQYVFYDLKPCAQYKVTVRGFTKIGAGPYSKPVNIETEKPGAAKALNMTFPFKTTGVMLTWEKPDGVNSILSYHVKQMGYKDYWPRFSDIKDYTSPKTRIQIMDLIPDTRYTFLVHVTTVCGNSSTVNKTVKTERDNPIAPDVPGIQYYNNTETVVNVTLWTAKEMNGQISAYQVIVSCGLELSPNHNNSLYNYTTSVRKHLHYYITAELPAKEINDTRVLPIGDGRVFNGMYANVPLVKGYQYFVYQRAIAYYEEEIFYGKEALVANIKVASAPSCPPQVTSVQAVSSTSISVTWSPLSDRNKCRLNGVLTGYKVAYKLTRLGSRVKYMDIRRSAVTTAVVTGLEKYTEYSFQVMAYTVKIGPLSKAIKTKTKEDAPTCSPTLTSASAVSSTSVKLTWTPLPNTKCRNGVLRGYRVSYKHKQKGSTMIDVGDRTSTVVSGLDKYTEYSFQVLAYTVKTGPLSKEIKTKTKEDAPTCSPRLTSASAVSSTSVKLNWTPLPNTKCRNGVLRGYRVSYNNSLKGILNSQNIKNSSATTAIVSGLEDYREYSFRVLAYTVKDGPWSNEIVRKTKSYKPAGAPQNVSVVKINITSYRVTWKPVRKDLRNGIITTYQVRLTLVGISKIVHNNYYTFQVPSKMPLEYVFHNLPLCAQYTVSVRAVTSKGPGPYSHSVAFATL